MKKNALMPSYFFSEEGDLFASDEKPYTLGSPHEQV
jgi:hypothetical protein